MVVVEAIANGTPAVVVAGEDNAAVELIAEGINGFVAPSASSKDLAKAILEIHHAGTSLRKTTAAWYDDNARRLSLENSLDQVLASYREQCREPRSSVYLL
jgi:glycosyltransferase involved in cell wall biosynthesis